MWKIIDDSVLKDIKIKTVKHTPSYRCDTDEVDWRGLFDIHKRGKKPTSKIKALTAYWLAYHRKTYTDIG